MYVSWIYVEINMNDISPETISIGWLFKVNLIVELMILWENFEKL